jgi:hypothetical protein
VKCVNGHGIYYKNTTNKHKLIVGIYVDDMIVTRNNEVEMTCFKRNIMNQFDMFDLGISHTSW